MSEDINININLDDLDGVINEAFEDDGINPFSGDFNAMRSRLNNAQNVIDDLHQNSDNNQHSLVASGIIGAAGLAGSATSAIGSIVGGAVGGPLGALVGGNFAHSFDNAVSLVIAGFLQLRNSMDDFIESLGGYSLDLNIAQASRDVLLTQQSMSLGRQFGGELAGYYNAETELLLTFNEFKAEFFTTIAPGMTLAVKFLSSLLDVCVRILNFVAHNPVSDAIRAMIKPLIDAAFAFMRWIGFGDDEPQPDLAALEQAMENLFFSDSSIKNDLFPSQKKRPRRPRP